MDQVGFRQFLSGRGLNDAQIEQHIQAVLQFEQFPHQQENENKTIRAFLDHWISTGENSQENLIALARYGLFSKNINLYLRNLELVDGAEAMGNLYNRLAKQFGQEIRDRIFAGISIPPLGSPNTEKVEINRLVIERMQANLDEADCKKLLGTGLRDLRDEWHIPERKKYQEAGNIETYLELKRSEFVAELEQIYQSGGFYYNQPITPAVIEWVRANPEVAEGVLEGSTLYVTKIPFLADQWLAETDPQKKRYLYCHCPWARESLAHGSQAVSAVFCNCSAAFHKKSWQVIFDQPIEAEVLESVLQGDDRCRFAIHLPL